MKKGKLTSKTRSKTKKYLRPVLFKDIIDQQRTQILQTQEGKFFVKKNHYILGTYSPFDSPDTQYHKASCITNYHIYSPKYTDPTISMYSIIMKKPIFFKSLLNTQIEIFGRNMDKIIYQDLRKVYILYLSIESYSDECFDIILDFFKKNNVKYNFPEAFRYAILHKNEYAFKTFSNILKANPSIQESFNDKNEFQNFINMKIPFKPYEAKTVKEYLSFLKIEKLGNNNLSEMNEDEQNAISVISNNGILENSPNSQFDDTKQSPGECSFKGCHNLIKERCPKCKKKFCSDHYNEHHCLGP